MKTVEVPRVKIRRIVKWDEYKTFCRCLNNYKDKTLNVVFTGVIGFLDWKTINLIGFI